MKKFTVILTLLLCACASTKTPMMKHAESEIILQVKNANFAQSYLNNPQSSIPKLQAWKKEDKIKERDTEIKGCIHNVNLFNKLAKQTGDTPLDVEQCFPYCDDKRICYIEHVKH